MAIKFSLQPVNGAQLVHIPGGVVGFHMLYLAFAVAPSAGTVKVEYREIGSTIFKQLQKVNGVSVTTGELAFRVDGPVAVLRVTFTGLVGGTLPLLWLETADRPALLYQGEAAMTVQDYISANVKKGLQFEASGLALAVAAGATVTVVFKTGAKEVLVKSRQVGFTGTRITAEVHKGVVFTPGSGVSVPIYNLSDVNPQPTTVEARLGATITNVGVIFGAPTYALGSEGVGNSSLGSFAVVGIERQLAANSVYSLTTTNNHDAAIDLSTYLTWFEGVADLPL